MINGDSKGSKTEDIKHCDERSPTVIDEPKESDLKPNKTELTQQEQRGELPMHNISVEVGYYETVKSWFDYCFNRYEY